MPHADIHSVRCKLVELQRSFINMKLECAQLFEQHNCKVQELQMNNQALEALGEMLSVVEEQSKKTQVPDMHRTIQQRLAVLRETRDNLKIVVKDSAAAGRNRVARMESAKLDLMLLSEQKDTCTRWLIAHGESRQTISALLENSCSSLTSSAVVDSTPTLPHDDKTTWYIECNRIDAERMLAGKPDGTFLIRPSSQHNSYALSIMCKGKPAHCIIEHKSTGYGFAADYYIHESLVSLVKHYHVTSLVEHNDQLDVRFTYPVNAPTTSLRQHSCGDGDSGTQYMRQTELPGDGIPS
jgi:phosphoinositide-3-kinase regulatory subunit